MNKEVTSPQVTNNDELIRKHYQEVAAKHGPSSRSTMEDEYVREKEVSWITKFVGAVSTNGKPLRVLDLGCGNGFTLEQLARACPGNQYWGVDFTEELLEIARQRNIAGAQFSQGDARSLQFESGSFDVVYTERCLINILDSEEQLRAVNEVARILRPGGHYLMIECFTDGLALNNKARRECGLPEIPEAYHNRYFDRTSLMQSIRGKLVALDPTQFGPELQGNFLSSYYFISRVLYPAICKGEISRNAEIPKFFSFLPPIGNYSPINALVLRKE